MCNELDGESVAYVLPFAHSSICFITRIYIVDGERECRCSSNPLYVLFLRLFARYEKRLEDQFYTGVLTMTVVYFPTSTREATGCLANPAKAKRTETINHSSKTGIL